MLSTEDLVDLGDDLRTSGFKLAAYQYFSAQQVLLHAAAAGLSDRRRLATLLGPIFCTSVLEQRRFGELFDSWLSRRFPEEHPAKELRDPASPAPKLGRSHLHGKIVIAAVSLVLACVAGRAYWQMQQPREIRGVVVAQPAMQSIAGAVIELGEQKVSSDKDGEFRILTTVRGLPATLNVSMKGFEPAKVPIGQDYKALRQRLYLWPRLTELAPVHVTLTLQ